MRNTPEDARVHIVAEYEKSKIRDDCFVSPKPYQVILEVNLLDLSAVEGGTSNQLGALPLVEKNISRPKT